MLRRITQSDVKGKTIKSVDNSADNIIKFTFTDDSTLELEGEILPTQAGSIALIRVEDNT